MVINYFQLNLVAHYYFFKRSVIFYPDMTNISFEK